MFSSKTCPYLVTKVNWPNFHMSTFTVFVLSRQIWSAWCCWPLAQDWHKHFEYKSSDLIVQSRHLTLRSCCLHFTSLKVTQIIHHVWRRRCCFGCWQWLRHVQSWFRWRWCSKGCIPIYCWSSPSPSMYSIEFMSTKWIYFIRLPGNELNNSNL